LTLNLTLTLILIPTLVLTLTQTLTLTLALALYDNWNLGQVDPRTSEPSDNWADTGKMWSCRAVQKSQSVAVSTEQM